MQTQKDIISYNIFSNSKWQEVYETVLCAIWNNNDYVETIGARYFFNPVTDHIMSNISTLFDIKKAAAMYFWYKSGDRLDHSIVSYFDEYKRCIDESHPQFNSNYGYYAYTSNGLQNCIKHLLKDKNSRQACFCINNNEAMASIDKLCTNVIHFFIRDNSLKMVVQMRSSNFITLLPYDAFMFSVFYMQVYKELRHTYTNLQTNLIDMQVASLHFYRQNLDNVKMLAEPIIPTRIIDFDANDCQEKLENYLLDKLIEL